MDPVQPRFLDEVRGVLLCWSQENERGRAKCCSKCAEGWYCREKHQWRPENLQNQKTRKSQQISSKCCSWGSVLPHFPNSAAGLCCEIQECNCSLPCLVAVLHHFHLLKCLIFVSPPCPRAVHPGTGITLSTTPLSPQTLRASQTCRQTLRRAPNR